MKTVYSLQPSSFCFGAERSISKLAVIVHNHPNTPIYCIHSLVHNPKVAQKLESQGVVFVESLDEVKDPDAIIVFSAHGINRNILQEAKEKFSAVYNLECPFVTKIYIEADEFVKNGIDTFFYIGKEHHQEGKNIVDYIRSQWATVFVFQAKEDIPKIQENTKLAVLSQTTLNFADVQGIIKKIRKAYPNANIPNQSDVCKATYDRQAVILQNLDKFDTFIVIWGKESNNTKELYSIGLKNNKLTFYGESLDDILQYPHDELLTNEKVAVTGWASTPQKDIQDVIDFFVANGYDEKALTLK